MPPPPPPSKSYLLRLSDSDLSSDDEDRQTCRPPPPPHNTFQSLAQDSNAFPHGERIHPGAALRKDTPETLATTVDDDEEEDIDDDDDEAIQEPPSEELLLDPLLATPTTRKTKRNRKKKRNKKRKTQQQAQQQQAVVTEAAAVAVTAKPQPQQRRIQFGNVTVRLFERELGTSVVPLDGGWPLGLGAEIVATETTPAPASTANVVTVDTYEAAKQERLLRRWNQHHQGVDTHATETDVQKNTKEDNSNDKDNVPPPPPPQPPVELETRQWDYKHRTKNPLFGLVTEKQRMALLLGEKDLDELLVEKYAKEQHQATSKSGSASPGGKNGKKNNNNPNNNNNSPGKKNKKGHNNNNNHGNNNNGKSRSNSWNGRTRSGSGNYHNNNPSNQERYNEQFTEYDVHHIRNELETIRNQRTQEESRGCTCRRLDVYIPPPGAGKKAAHRRMNVQKVKEELRKRHALPTKHQTREELELLLHDLVAQEPCCRDDNHCPCVKNGIECQSDACQCWHASHQSKTTHKKTAPSSSSSSDEITPAVIRGRCGNRFGMSTVDVNHIGQYRAPFVTATNMVCQPIVAAETEAANVP